MIVVFRLSEHYIFVIYCHWFLSFLFGICCHSTFKYCFTTFPDIATKSVEQAEDRWKNRSRKVIQRAEFISADCTRVSAWFYCLFS